MAHFTQKNIEKKWYQKNKKNLPRQCRGECVCKILSVYYQWFGLDAFQIQKKEKKHIQGDHMMRDGNHRLGSFKNADLASLIFRSGKTVYLTLVKIQYHYSIAGPWKHGWIRSISVVMANVKHNYDKLATLICKSGTPVHLVLFKKAPFECSSPKTWV